MIQQLYYCIEYTPVGTDIWGDAVFSANGTIFTMSVGDRVCFDVAVIDDNAAEATETFKFLLDYHSPLNVVTDVTSIVVVDNEGQ